VVVPDGPPVERKIRSGMQVHDAKTELTLFVENAGYSKRVEPGQRERPD
jgi:hypothetical protein